MATKKSSVEDVMELLADLLDERNRAVEEHAEWLREIDRRIESVTVVSDMLRERRNPVDELDPETVALSTAVSLVEGSRTQMEALVRLARAGDGTVKTSEAKDILFQAGLAKGKRRNISPHLWNLLNNSADWEKVGAGTFRLIEGWEQQVMDDYKLMEAVP